VQLHFLINRKFSSYSLNVSMAKDDLQCSSQLPYPFMCYIHGWVNVSSFCVRRGQFHKKSILYVKKLVQVEEGDLPLKVSPEGILCSLHAARSIIIS